MTQDEAIQTVRELSQKIFCPKNHTEYLAFAHALDVIEQRVLPELPEHWRICSIRHSTVNDFWGCVIKHIAGNCHVLGVEGWDETPRAAVLAAISKIK